MEIRQHGRYDYSPITERADYDWPDGKRLAFFIGLNVEHFSFGEGLGHTTTAPGKEPDVRNHAWRDYGLRVGIWRLFDLFEELGLPASHLVNAAVYDHAPQIIERIRARGDEIIGHGRTNSESQINLWEDDERRLIADATETIARHEGKGPAGWLGPWIAESEVTLDLLQEAGYRYVMDWPCDDQPIWMKTRSGPLLSMPYPLEINDSPAMLTRRHTAEQFADMAIGQFEEMLRQSAAQPLVCGISLHTFVVGQPYRLAQLRRILKHIVEHPDAERIWFTRPVDIADHIESLPPGTVPGDPRAAD
jgi:peptidoglycan/xylan/chitin deacetylase (PgdA/CDA1 family)